MSAPPFFVVGPSRSGTTLLGALLASHSRLAVYNESQFYPLFRPDLHRYGDLARPRNLELFVRHVREALRVQGFLRPFDAAELAASLPEPTFERVLEQVLVRYARQEGKVRAGEKTPAHTDYLAEIRRSFPASPLLFTIRDPRDVARSMRQAFGSSTERACWHWSRSFDAYRAAAADVHLVRYEELVTDPHSTLASVCRALGEPFDEGMLRFHEWAAERKPAGHNRKLGTPVDVGSVGRFREMPAEDVARVEEACAEGMEQLGYARAHPARPPRPPRPPGRAAQIADRIRFYGFRKRRWRYGWMRWRIVLEVRLRYLVTRGFGAGG